MQTVPRTLRAAASAATLHDRRLLAGFIAAVVATAVASLVASGSARPAAAQTNASHAASGAVVKMMKTRLGSTLVDARGRTLYFLTADKRARGKSACYAACAVAWPPLLTKGTPKAGPGVKASLLGVARRTNGATQVTYNGNRLYLFVKDKAARQTNGQKLTGFGGPFCTATLATKPCVWYALSPAGVRAK
jgi:predicted lipoprotein with Yx(FWY)xxD motif